MVDWHPSGPVFVIFAFGAVASGSGGWGEVPIALGVSLASALFAILIGGVGAVVRRIPGGRVELRSPRTIEPLRFLLVVGIAGAIAVIADIGSPY